MILRLNDLLINCILGDLPEERHTLQPILVSIELEVGDEAGVDDRLESTVDYAALAARLTAVLEKAECRLLERAAKLLVDECMNNKLVRMARCTVRKSSRLKNLGSAEVVYECG